MKKRFIEKLNMTVINIVFASILFVVFSYYFLRRKNYGFLILAAVCFVFIVTLNALILFFKKKAAAVRVKALSFYLNGKDAYAGAGAIRNFSLPLAFLSDAGTYIWSNELFAGLFRDRNEMIQELKNIYLLHIRPKIELLDCDLSFEIMLGDRCFITMVSIVNTSVGSRDGYAVMLYLIDKTSEKQLLDTYNRQRIAVGEIVLDSYEEIYQTNGEIVINSIAVELSKLIDKWLKGKKAIAKKMVRDRYFIVMEDESLNELIKDKFSILSEAKKINVGNSIPVTLSIGISTHEDSVVQNDEKVSQAIETASSRGGDQAVVKYKGKPDSYYGAGNVELESLNEVKARVVANQLKDLILSSSKVLVMGHSIPDTDMDSLGACLAVYRAATLLNKRARIVLKEQKELLRVMLEEIQRHPEYDDVFINTSYALAIRDDNTLIVVVDVSDASRTEVPRLLEGAERIAVIDHHRRGPEYIKNTLLDYNEVTASSTSELMIEILKYMHPGLAIPKVEAEAMYAGILVDTKNLVFKTGRRTFAAASFLRGQNVDTVSVRKYTQPDLETFLEITKVTSNARIFFGKISISKARNQTRSRDLVISIAADQLLNVLGIEASFVLFEQEDGSVKITARSLGEINVQVIMGEMGGGGHLTAAAAVIRGASMEETERALLKNIKDYLYA